MNINKDGGPAFPFIGPIDLGGPGEAEVAFPGMSLRDWFAGLALAGLVQDRETQRVLRDRHKDDDKELYELMAEATYKLADAMLEARGE